MCRLFRTMAFRTRNVNTLYFLINWLRLEPTEISEDELVYPNRILGTLQTSVVRVIDSAGTELAANNVRGLLSSWGGTAEQVVVVKLSLGVIAKLLLGAWLAFHCVSLTRRINWTRVCGGDRPSGKLIACFRRSMGGLVQL